MYLSQAIMTGPMVFVLAKALTMCMSDTEFNIIKYIPVICDSLLNSIHIQIISFGFFKWSQGNGGITHLNIIACTELNVWPLSEIREMYLVRWAND